MSDIGLTEIFPQLDAIIRVSRLAIDGMRLRVSGQYADLHDSDAAAAREIFARGDERTPYARASSFFDDKEFSDIEIATFFRDNVDVVNVLARDSPTNCTIRFIHRDKNLTSMLGCEFLHAGEMFFGNGCIEAAIGLECVLETLRAHDEFAQSRSVTGEIGVADGKYAHHRKLSAAIPKSTIDRNVM
jgi:hypothetical protein